MINNKTKTDVVTKNIINIVHKFPDGNYGFFISRDNDSYSYIIEEVVTDESKKPNDFTITFEVVPCEENGKVTYKTNARIDTNIKDILSKLTMEEKSVLIKDTKSIIDDIKAGLPIYNK